MIIGICDDEKRDRERLRELCEQYLATRGQEHSFIEFRSGEEVLEYDGEVMQVLFLDIEMKEASGLDVLEKLRGNDLVWRIVFVTSHEELKWDTIDLKTLAFLPKPVEQGGVVKCLETVIRESIENIDVSIKTIDGDCYLKLDEILFVQAQGNYVSIRSSKLQIMGYDSIKKIEEQLSGTTIIRVHKSYLVNLQYVKNINRNDVMMTDGTSIPIGRKYYQETKEAYFAFLKSVTIERTKRA